MGHGCAAELESAGKFEPETAALAGRRFEAEFTLEAFDAFADKSETDAGSRIGMRRVEAFEEAEDFLVVVRMDANAVVFDGDADEGCR